MEQQDVQRIDATIQQLKLVWIAIVASAPFSAMVLVAAIPAQQGGGMLAVAAAGVLSGLPALPMVWRYRAALDAFVNSRVSDATALMRALVLGAAIAEAPMLIGIVQYAMLAHAPTLLLLCAESFALMLLFRPTGR